MTNHEQLEASRMAYAGIGLAVIGAGLSVAMDAGTRRARGADTMRWVGQGTLGLALLGTGLSLFGEGVALRAVQLVGERADSQADLASA